MRMVLESALGLVCAGLAIGIPISAWGRHTAASVVHSPPAEAAVIPIIIGAAAMIALAVVAAYVPARRASRVHPDGCAATHSALTRLLLMRLSRKLPLLRQLRLLPLLSLPLWLLPL